MKKKHWPILVGLSVVAGVTSSWLLSKGKAKSVAPLSLSDLYQGRWWYIDQKQKVQHTLEINEEYQLVMDDTPISSQLIEVTPHKLVLRDQYGYFLSVLCKDDEPYSFYDEANDINYLLENRQKNKQRV